MTPEQQEQFRERMRARGVAVPAGEQSGNTPALTTQAQPARRTAAAAPPPARGATTFDALFPPLTSTESFGQVWLHLGGKLQRVRLRLGITDGQQTELIQALDGDVQEGTEVVTSVTLGAVRQTATPAGGNAFPGLGGGRQGGGGGFGGGRGGG